MPKIISEENAIRLANLQLDKARLQAQLSTNAFLSEAQQDDMYDHLNLICEQIDIIELDEVELAAKRQEHLDSIPF